MDEDYQQTNVDTKGTCVPEPLSQSPVSLLQSGPPVVTPPPSQQPPPTLVTSSEATVTFPSSGNTTASFSSGYISQGVDLTSLTPGDLSSGFGGQLAHKCVKCSDSFATPYELAIHWQEEHRDNYKCKRCERCFAKKHNLQRHNCVNACNVCGQQFTRRYNLKLHMQIHGDGSKMYKCEYCGKSFTRRYTLLTHTRSHSGIKLFKCSICGKAFTRQHTLNLHLKRHVTKASFFCRKCYAVFTDAVSLQLHRETEHAKANKGQTTQGSSTSQSIQSSSSVVFPNSNPGYIYGTENVGLPPTYRAETYYQEEQQTQANQLQSVHGDGSSSHTNPEQGGFDNSRDNNLMPETSGHSASLDKQDWFEDSGRGSSARQIGNLNPPTFEENSGLQGSSSNIVTVMDSEEEALQEESQCPNESVDVKQETRNHNSSVCQDSEAKEGNERVGQEAQPVEETRRSIFPMDNSKRDKRMGRSMHRSARNAWKHGDRLVKETAEIRIDIVDPNSLEEINPLLTPPRSSDTSTPRLNHASSESGSPGTASFLEMSPSYPNNPHHPSRMKPSQGIMSGTPEDKSCFLSRAPSQETADQPSLRKSTPYRHGNKVHIPSHRGANDNSDSSSSEMATQRSSLPVPRQAAKRGSASPNSGGNWRCAHCGITFEESLMYVVHMGCHGQQDPFQCSMCGLACQDRMAFTLHIIGGKHVRPKP